MGRGGKERRGKILQARSPLIIKHLWSERLQPRGGNLGHESSGQDTTWSLVTNQNADGGVHLFSNTLSVQMRRFLCEDELLCCLPVTSTTPVHTPHTHTPWPTHTPTSSLLTFPRCSNRSQTICDEFAWLNFIVLRGRYSPSLMMEVKSQACTSGDVPSECVLCLTVSHPFPGVTTPEFELRYTNWMQNENKSYLHCAFTDKQICAVASHLLPCKQLQDSWYKHGCCRSASLIRGGWHFHINRWTMNNTSLASSQWKRCFDPLTNGKPQAVANSLSWQQKIWLFWCHPKICPIFKMDLCIWNNFQFSIFPMDMWNKSRNLKIW